MENSMDKLIYEGKEYITTSEIIRNDCDGCAFFNDKDDNAYHCKRLSQSTGDWLFFENIRCASDSIIFKEIVKSGVKKKLEL